MSASAGYTGSRYRSRRWEVIVIRTTYTSAQQNTIDRTPGLGQIPILKWLFQRERIDDESRELLIFITPRIIKA